MSKIVSLVLSCPEVVPHLLRDLPQWVCWRYEARNGVETKVPVCARSGALASSMDSETWCTFDEALDAVARLSCDGVGFVFAQGGGVCGIDLDGCIDGNGRIAPSAQSIIDSLDSYTEVSPSGTGVKVFLLGSKPQGARCRSKAVEGFREIEVYDHGRFFTVTGVRVPGTPGGVEWRQAPLETLCARLWPTRPDGPPPASPPPPPAAGAGVRPWPPLTSTVANAAALSDEEILVRAASAANGEKFQRLWRGDTLLYQGDDSAADMALCCLLAFWANRDPERIDRLFRRSGLMRAKWDEARGGTTYGRLTVENACRGVRETFSGADPIGAAAATGAEPSVVARLGERDASSGRLVLDPRHSLPSAQAFLREHYQHVDRPKLIHQSGEFFEWTDNCYRFISDERLRARIFPWLDGAFRPKGSGLTPLEVTTRLVEEVLSAVRLLVTPEHEVAAPCWLDGGEDRPSARELLVCPSGSVHLPTGEHIVPTPLLFVRGSLGADLADGPESVVAWTTFLGELFGDDTQRVELLQEWFGYCLLQDMRLQKALLIIGPRRSGKGTIARVLGALLGQANVVSPTTSGLAGPFGLQQLLGKTLAVISDARLSGRDAPVLVERLLSIIGEDALTIDRKYLGAVTTRLPTKFVVLTNEIPSWNDTSNALAGRLLVLKLTESFYGREDIDLTNRLLRELPGILRWSIEGWRRLHARGCFVEPASSSGLKLAIEESASPLGQFIRERCEIGKDRRVPVDRLYDEFSAWCLSRGHPAPTSKPAFGRELNGLVTSLQTRRGTDDSRFYEGIGLLDKRLAA